VPVSSTSPLDKARAPVTAALERVDPDQAVVVTALVEARKDRRREFEERADRFRDEVRAIPAVTVTNYSALAETAQTVRYLFYEAWRTAEDFRKRWFSRELEQFGQDVMPFLAAPPHFEMTWGHEGTRSSGVLRTGAVKCWDTEGREIDCTGTGQDADVMSGVPPVDPRFTDNYDGTVTDNLTNLIWLKDADAFGEVEWKDALDKARALAHGSGGLSDNSKRGDWRLANIRELLSLIDYGEADPILPYGHPFQNVKTAIYWTSTTLAAAPRLAWMITLGIGPTVFVVKNTPARMWPVRGTSTRVLQTGQENAWNTEGELLSSETGTGQDGEMQAGIPLPTSSQRFDDRKNGTVRDQLTGLVWLKNADAFSFKTWSHALECCRTLEQGKYGLADGSVAGDWRLPNIREIESLVDYGRAGPCLPDDHPFDNVRPSSYWTSTTVAAGPTEAMFIILGVGPSIFENKEHWFYVWPVRNSRPDEKHRR
jgi:quinol monooxygenase YgiN